MHNPISLFELNSLVAQVIDISLSEDYWVVAELSELREVRGHCYMELVEKDALSHTPTARASAKCWASRWSMLRPIFERVTGQRLAVGMKVMLCVHAQFHPAYGFSWIVFDINPEYTMGDIARRRLEIIRKLKAEGVFDLQRELILPAFAQRIAVVSSEGAAGYGDFCRHLECNESHYTFDVTLFNAVMQGEHVEKSVISALNAIYDDYERFDCVVIIRGGGATSDLSGFDTLDLAENVANFPLPIITGIGHERDETILDMVSFRRVKTPTAAAQLLVDNLAHTDALLSSLADRLTIGARRIIEHECLRLSTLSERIPMLFSLVGAKQSARINNVATRISAALRQCIASQTARTESLSVRVDNAARRIVASERHRIELLAQRVEAENPDRLLRRGYSITTYAGKAVRNAASLPDGAVVETRVEQGSFKSKVEK